MNVSLTERCYDLLRREAPVASDLRFIVSVLRVLSELERIGDLALRVIKLAPDHETMASNSPTFDIVRTMADEVVRALSRWPAGVGRPRPRPRHRTGHAVAVDGRVLRAAPGGAAPPRPGPTRSASRSRRLPPGARSNASTTTLMIIGARLRYLLTGDPDHLAAEVR